MHVDTNAQNFGDDPCLKLRHRLGCNTTCANFLYENFGDGFFNISAFAISDQSIVEMLDRA